MAYRDDTWDGKTCLEYTKDQGLIDIKDDKTKVSAFLNPVLPEVQDFCLNFIKELVTNYNFFRPDLFQLQEYAPSGTHTHIPSNMHI